MSIGDADLIFSLNKIKYYRFSGFFSVGRVASSRYRRFGAPIGNAHYRVGVYRFLALPIATSPTKFAILCGNINIFFLH